MTNILITIKTLIWRLTLKWLVNPKKIVNVHGDSIMYLDDKDSLLLSLRTNYEPKHTRFMKSIIKEGDIVVDIGANIGYYTILLSKLVGNNGKVFAFEPDPKNFSVLEKNILVNKLNNVVLEHKALSNKTGEINLFFSEINSGDSRTYSPLKVNDYKLKLMTNENENRKSVRVSSIRLDNYFKKIKIKPKFIKIDVQGFEPAVFEGMQDILKEQDVIFTTEFWPDGIKSARYNPILFLESLKKMGFNIYDLDEHMEIIDLNNYLKHIKNGRCYSTLIGSRSRIYK